jgi:hypothetical protein
MSVENPAPGSDISGAQRNQDHGNRVRDPDQRLDRMEHIMVKTSEALLQEISMKKRANKARKRRKKQRRSKDVALNQLTEFPTTLPHGPPQTVGIVEIPPIDEKGTHPPTQDWIPPEESHVDAEIQKDSEPEGWQPVCGLPTEDKQITPMPTRAQIRRDRFPPKPLTRVCLLYHLLRIPPPGPHPLNLQ